MRVLILWADRQSANLGVRAVAQGTAALLERIPTVSSIGFQDFEAGDSSVAFNAATMKGDVVLRRGFVRARLAEFDAILDTGAGDSFTDIYGLKRAVLMEYVRSQARAMGLPILFGPQTVGPFRTSTGSMLARRTLRAAPLVVSRDPVSHEAAVHLGAKRVVRGTDVVFALEQGQPVGSFDVIVNPSGLLWNTNHLGSSSRYRDSLKALIDGLLADGRRVTLMAHVLDRDTVDNDVTAVRSLASYYGSRTGAIVPNSLDEARGLIAGARLVIGSRMHACLNALSLGVPAIAWSYSRKFGPLFDDIGWPGHLDIATTDNLSAATLQMVDDPEAARTLEALRVRVSNRLDDVCRETAAVLGGLVR